MDLDLFDDRFPHGTLAGYSKGCSGLSCPLELDAEYLSCREVSKTVQGQTVVRIGRYDKVARGGEVARAVPRPPATPTPAPTPAVDAMSDELPADTSPPEVADELHHDTRPLAPAHPPTEAAPKKRGAPAPHGTVLTHTRGCRTDDECPNFGTRGAITCREARKQYDHERHVRRQAEQAEHSTAAQQPSIEESAAATDLMPSSIEHEPAPEETSVPDPAPIPAATVDVVEAGYPDDVDHLIAPAEIDPTMADLLNSWSDQIKTAREIELEGQLQRVNGEKIRLEQDLERAHAEIARADRQHKADDALIQQSRARDAELVVAGTGGESPPALAEAIELTVRGVHLSLQADSGLEVRAIGDAVFVRAGR